MVLIYGGQQNTNIYVPGVDGGKVEEVGLDEWYERDRMENSSLTVFYRAA